MKNIKINNKSIIYTLISILLVLISIIGGFHLQKQISKVTDLSNNDNFLNILDRNYSILRCELVERGFFVKHNELYFDILSDEDLQFYDVDKLGTELDSSFTPEYSLKNIYFNVYQSNDNFINDYDNTNDNSMFSFIVDFKKNDSALLTQNFILNDIDITKESDENLSSLYTNLFKYDILSAKKDTKHIKVSLVSPETNNLYSNTKSLLKSMQLLENNIRTLNSFEKEISIDVYNSLIEQQEDFIYNSSYWTFKSSNKSLLKLNKLIPLRVEYTEDELDTNS